MVDLDEIKRALGNSCWPVYGRGIGSFFDTLRALDRGQFRDATADRASRRRATPSLPQRRRTSIASFDGLRRCGVRKHSVIVAAIVASDAADRRVRPRPPSEPVMTSARGLAWPVPIRPMPHSTMRLREPLQPTKDASELDYDRYFLWLIYLQLQSSSEADNRLQTGHGLL